MYQTVMNLEFFKDGPALIIEGDQRLLVVADLHFGIEADLAAHGLHFRSRSAERVKRLLKIIDTADPDLLILLGDVKHSIPSLTRQEFNELPGILEAIRSRIPMKVFPGNHDIGIERYLVESEIQQKDGAVVDGVGYLHGHTYPSPLLAGHLMVIGQTRWDVPSRHLPTCGPVLTWKGWDWLQIRNQPHQRGYFLCRPLTRLPGMISSGSSITRSRRFRDT
jgi:3',5'-cyclic AMP phosphodiesterase CpdA